MIHLFLALVALIVVCAIVAHALSDSDDTTDGWG
jgi:hypothetical protein